MKWRYFGYGVMVCCALAFGFRHFNKKTQPAGQQAAPTAKEETKADKEEVEFVPLMFGAVSSEVQNQFVGKATSVSEGIILKGTRKNIDDFKFVLKNADTAPKEYMIDVLLLSVDTTDTNKTGLSILIDTLLKQDNQLKLKIDPAGAVTVNSGISQILSSIEAGSSKVKIDGRSQLSVLAGDPASIKSGERRAIIDQTTQTNGQVSTSYKFIDIGLSLSVEILPGSTDKAAALKIQQSSDSVVGLTLISGVEVPIISQRQLKTSVRADIGETIVLGGLSLDTLEKRFSGVPFLKSIPFVGKFFSATALNKSKSDLIIVLQPVVTRVNRLDYLKKEYSNYLSLKKSF